MLSVGAVIEGAFRLVRERIGAVAVWGLVYLLCYAAALAAMRPMFRAIVAAEGGAPDPGELLHVLGWVWLIDIVALFAVVVLFAAAFRAVLRPEASAFAYMRVGMDELRLLGLALLIGIGAYLAMLLGTVVIVVVSRVLGLVAGEGLGAFVAVVLTLALCAVLFYLLVRLSLAGPLTIYRGRFVLGESLELTRGRFWPLFLAYLVIGLLLMLVQTILSTLLFMPVMSGFMREMMQSPGDPAAAQAVVSQLFEQMTSIGPLTIALVVFGAILGALWVALAGGAAAVSARLLLGAGDPPAAFD